MCLGGILFYDGILVVCKFMVVFLNVYEYECLYACVVFLFLWCTIMYRYISIFSHVVLVSIMSVSTGMLLFKCRKFTPKHCANNARQNIMHDFNVINGITNLSNFSILKTLSEIKYL